ncbi:MAG: hypothetical protein ACRD12_03080, partial [Acidimicrobiales bacterium]
MTGETVLTVDLRSTGDGLPEGPVSAIQRARIEELYPGISQHVGRVLVLAATDELATHSVVVRRLLDAASISQVLSLLVGDPPGPDGPRASLLVNGRRPQRAAALWVSDPQGWVWAMGAGTTCQPALADGLTVLARACEDPYVFDAVTEHAAAVGGIASPACVVVDLNRADAGEVVRAEALALRIVAGDDPGGAGTSGAAAGRIVDDLARPLAALLGPAEVRPDVLRPGCPVVQAIFEARGRVATAGRVVARLRSRPVG